MNRFSIKLLATALSALVMTAAVSAHQVTADRARTIAANTFDARSAISAKSAFKSAKGTLTLLNGTLKKAGNAYVLSDNAGTQQDAPAFHIFNNSQGGFIIIAADDVVEPVLAYSDTGSFDADNIPDNVADWLLYLQNGINFLRSNGIQPSKKVSDKWLAAENGTATRASVVKLCATPEWNQSAPYNAKMPDWDGKGSWVGCVPLALAMVMRYHKHPDHGHRTLDSYSYQDENNVVRNITGHKLGHKYDWDNMPLTNNTSQWTQAQKDQVAQLAYDCAVACQTMICSVTSSGSGAMTSMLDKAMRDYFFYKRLKSFRADSDEEWITTVKKNIDDYGPVIHSAGGHCFVVDGYNSDSQFHVNFGWGGSFNGYYTYPNFYNFTSGRVTYIDIQKDDSTTILDRITFNYNPEQNNITIATEPEVEYTVKDAAQQTVLSGNLENSNGALTIDTRNFNNGPYTLTLTLTLGETVENIKISLPRR